MSVRFNSLLKYEGLDHVAACLTEPLAVSLTAVLNAQIPLGGSVAVLGPGPLGLMAARVAKLRGAACVVITGLPADNPRERARLELAAKFGCDAFIETGKQDVEAEVKRKFPKGVDRVIVSSPPESLYDAPEDHQASAGSSPSSACISAAEHDPGGRQRSDFPEDLADSDLRRAGHQLPRSQPVAARGIGRCPGCW